MWYVTESRHWSFENSRRDPQEYLGKKLYLKIYISRANELINR